MNSDIALPGQAIQRVMSYLKLKYPKCIIKVGKSKSISNIKSFLQADYGKENDCSITAMATVFYHKLNGQVDFDHIYNVVEQAGYDWGYGDWGTKTYSIKSIMERSAKVLNVKQKAIVKHYKGIMWNINSVMDLIDKGNPMVLAIQKDGRRYYDKHSVTIMGYAQYDVTFNGQTFTESYLRVFDNWTKTPMYIDYQLLGMLSCINYMQ